MIPRAALKSFYVIPRAALICYVIPGLHVICYVIPRAAFKSLLCDSQGCTLFVM